MSHSTCVSVIVPVYNVEPYLAECVESILRQTYRDFELILVDDGSTDASGRMCDGFARRDPRIRVIHKPNGGLSSARNAGLDVARGEYVSFVDSDDALHQQFLETLLNYASPETIVSCLFCYPIDFYAEQIRAFNDALDVQLLDPISEPLNGERVSVCTKVFPKSCFSHIRFPAGMIYEDRAVIHRLIGAVAIGVLEIRRGLYFVRERPDSIRHGDLDKSFRSECLVNAYIDACIFYSSKEKSKSNMYATYQSARQHLLRWIQAEGMNERTSQYHRKLKNIFLRRRFPVKKRFGELVFFLAPSFYMLISKLRSLDF